VLTEHEPVFDAADLTRCGKDIFVQLSNVTNRSGIEWLQRHYADYTFHPMTFADDRAIHIDCTFVPLAPGKLLINPDRPIHGEIPPMLTRLAKRGNHRVEDPHGRVDLVARDRERRHEAQHALRRRHGVDE
jgi:N-dimethylarginine dimethylaminohydrolase